MVNRSLLRQFQIATDDIEQGINEAFSSVEDWLPAVAQDFGEDRIVKGRVRKVTAESVLVDIGFKSEGVVELREWFDETTRVVVPPQPGDELDVLVLASEDATGAVKLSFSKARWQKRWESILATKKPGDVVSGTVVRKIKGGVLVNIGVNVFLPASQVDVRRPSDFGEYLGKTVECKVVSIDVDRRNVVVSRRQLIEDRNQETKAKLLAEIEPGQTRRGIVRNIASFGAFVDLGGVDGLMHVTDMAWHRVRSPEEIVQINQSLEVFVIKIDKTNERISVGLKQLTANPWNSVAERFQVGRQYQGSVVNVVSYGAFVSLEPGIEGLVHISEMSWTKRISYPSEVVEAGATINVQVLAIDIDKKEISLGIKQTLDNPWDHVLEKYSAGMQVDGTIRNLANYGAFVEIEEGVDGLVHLNDVSWVRKVSHPKEIFKVGEVVRCVILEVDRDRRRISLGLKQIADDPWASDIPNRYFPGVRKTGSVVKITNFGLFIELEKGLEGLLHMSEISDVSSIEVGDSIEVVVLRLEMEGRKIGLGLPTSGKELTETDESSRLVDQLATKVSQKQQGLRGGIAGGASIDRLVAMSRFPTSEEKDSVNPVG